MDIKLLVKITSRAWGLHILASIHQGTAARQATLLAATKAGRTAFVQSLNRLIDLQLIERNPGHGHPLRPEYRLTALGQTYARIAAEVLKIEQSPIGRATLRKTWALPVLTLSHKPQHFTGLKQKLPPITDRALSQTLKQLEDQRWITRSVQLDLRPIRPLYQAADKGALISLATQPIAA